MNRILRFLLLIAGVFVFGVGCVLAQTPTLDSLTSGPFAKTGTYITFSGTNLRLGNGAGDVLEVIKGGIVKFTYANGEYEVDTSAGSTTLDSLSFLVPPELSCEPYQFRLITDTGGSPDSSMVSVPVSIRDSINLSYMDSLFCMGDINPLPVIIPGFDTASFRILGDSIGPYVDPTSGEYWIQSGGIGSYVIEAYYDNINGSFGCKDSLRFPMTIRMVDTSAVWYPPSPYCPLDTFVLPDSLTDPGGTFRGSSGLVLDTVTGKIDIRATPSGSYSIFYYPPHDSCAMPDTVSITIQAVVKADFQYDSLYCKGSGFITPLINYRPSGVFSDTLVPGNLFYDPSTGEVNLDSSSPGIYTLFYQPSAVSCADTVGSTFEIFNTDTAYFRFISDTVCSNYSILSPDMGSINPSIGTGYFRDTSGAFVLDTVTGVVTVAGSPTGGPYYIFYVNGSTVCPDSFAAPLTILVKDSFAISYSKIDYCGSDSNTSPIFTSGPTGGTFLSNPPSGGVSAASGVLAFDLFTPATSYKIQYISPNNTCGDTVDVDSIYVHPPVSAAYSLPNGGMVDSVCHLAGAIPFSMVNGSYPTDIFTLYGPGGIFSGAINSNNEINTDTILPGGPFRLVRVVKGLADACQDSVTTYLTIEPKADASFYYVDSIICQDATDPIPLITGLGGGTFSVDSMSMLSVNQFTGRVDLGSALGKFGITYTVGANCPGQMTDSLEILPQDPVFFYNNGPTFCDFDSIITINTAISSTQVGIFTSNTTYDTLALDSMTGTILLDSSYAGTYSVIFSLTNNSVCNATYSREITIIAADDTTTMGYQDTLFCPSDSDPTPIVVGSQGGQFIPVLGISFLDTLGKISLSNSIPSPDYYYITYKLPGECGLSLVDSIKIRNFESSQFEYATDRFCNSDTNPFPLILGSPGGFFSATDDLNNPVPLVDTVTGEFFLDQVILNNVKYFVSYDAATGCTNPTSQLVTIFRGPSNARLEPDNPLPSCSRVQVELDASGSDNGYQWFVNGLLITTINDSANMMKLYNNGASLESNHFLDSTVVRVVYENGAGCRDTLTRVLRVKPTPQISIQDSLISISGNEQVYIEVQSLLDGTFLRWQANSTSAVQFSQQNGLEGPVDSADFHTIVNQMSLLDDTSPAEVTMVVSPTLNACDGIPRTVFIKVNPNDQAIFVPGVITPDGNGLNDKWLIQWRNDVNPQEYTILLYNRSGGLVRTLEGLSQDFTGESLPDGVYWYKILDKNGLVVRADGLTIRRR